MARDPADRLIFQLPPSLIGRQDFRPCVQIEATSLATRMCVLALGAALNRAPRLRLPTIPPKESGESPIRTIGKNLLSLNNCIYLVRPVGRFNGPVARKQPGELFQHWPGLRNLHSPQRRQRRLHLPRPRVCWPAADLFSALSLAWLPCHGASIRAGLSGIVRRAKAASWPSLLPQPDARSTLACCAAHAKIAAYDSRDRRRHSSSGPSRRTARHLGGPGRGDAAVAGRLDGGGRPGPAHESAPARQAGRGQDHAGLRRRQAHGARSLHHAGHPGHASGRSAGHAGDRRRRPGCATSLRRWSPP